MDAHPQREVKPESKDSRTQQHAHWQRQDQASKRFRKVSICNPDQFAAIVPATSALAGETAETQINPHKKCFINF